MRKVCHEPYLVPVLDHADKEGLFDVQNAMIILRLLYKCVVGATILDVTRAHS